eukprot:3153747-Pyramimonas_sp.AAC.1
MQCSNTLIVVALGSCASNRKLNQGVRLEILLGNFTRELYDYIISLGCTAKMYYTLCLFARGLYLGLVLGIGTSELY